MAAEGNDPAVVAAPIALESTAKSARTCTLMWAIMAGDDGEGPSFDAAYVRTITDGEEVSHPSWSLRACSVAGVCYDLKALTEESIRYVVSHGISGDRSAIWQSETPFESCLEERLVRIVEAVVPISETKRPA
jgi:hypothetical protein